MNEPARQDKQVQPIDSRIAKNPIGIIRMKNKDGGFLFSEEECLRLLAVFVDRAKQLEKAEEGKRIGFSASDKLSFYKATGRGLLFWRDSE
jgi:hypothetical protein